MAFWIQLMLLLWKNFLYRRRQPIQLLVELMWPLFLFFILVAVRHSHPPLEQHECHFSNKPLPSAGTIPWLQGLICNVNNTCFPQPTPGEEPGVLSNFKDSLVSRFLADMRTVLGSPSARRMLASLRKLTPTLKAAQGARAAWSLLSDQPKEGPSSATELLETLLRGESLGFTLGQAQESIGSFVEAAEDLAQELLALPSLVGLLALLRRPQGTGGPLEVVVEALCSAKGPSKPEGPSLNWYEASDLKELVGQEPVQALPDRSLSPACTELMGSLDTHPVSRLLWRRLKPLVLGKVLFAPDTPFTRQLMTQVNRTFQELALLKDIQEVWGLLGPQLFAFMNDSANVAMLQRLLQIQDKGSRQPGPRGRDQVEALRAFLNPRSGSYSWQEALADVGHLVGTLGRVMECVTLDKLEAVPSEAALVERALELISEHRFWAGIVFLGPEDFSVPGHVRIKIRMDIDDVTRTNNIRDRFWDPGPAANPLRDLRYVWGGFVYLQDLLERAAVHVLTGASPRVGLYLQQMPYPCYVDDAFLRVLSRSLPLFLTLAWIYSVALTVKAVVREKETRLRYTMRAMGLSGAVLWLGWFLSSLGPFLLSTALLVLVLKLGDILPYSHPVVLFLFLASFAMATVVQSFLLSAFFSHANLAAACGGLAYFVLYLPYVLCVAWRDQLPMGGRVAASLLSPVAFGFGCESLALLEEQGEGAQWHNVGTGPAADVFSLAQVSGLLLFDAVLYGLATWYLEAVCPGQYGIPEPWNFPFRRSYWFGTRSPNGSAPPAALQDPEVLVEEAPPGLIPGVSIRGLEKRFPGNLQPALRGLSLDFYQGHITAFLGHNGAGKTTTLSILSGLFPPTGGSARVLGHDVRSSMAAIRPYLGVCPQYNVLFDMLTVDEHVWFYGRLKGLSAAAVGPEQDRLLQDVGLVPKRHTQTRHLSGGMQRKLSVAIAFVGGSRVVILDEPTAGVDPASRRGIWELLLKYRKGRTLILSTHHLDEAELLGDRVAVVAGGRLCCCGSPLFLRHHLGSGYYLTLAKGPLALAASRKGDTALKDSMDAQQEREQSSTAGPLMSPAACAGAVQLLALVQRQVPGARLVEELPHELVLTLPYKGALDGSFAGLFQELDQRLEELGLAGYGISDTSLEEIFLKVVEDCAVATGPEDAATDSRRRQHPCSGIAHRDMTTRFQVLPEEAALEDGALAGSAPETQALQGSGPDAAGRLQGWALTRQQLWALLLKRFLLACRSRRGLFAQIVLPALFVGLALVFSLIVPPFGFYPALQLSASMYGTQVSFFSEDAPRDPARARLLEALLEEAGLEQPYLKNNSTRAQECAQPSCQFSVPEIPADVAEVLARGNWTSESPSPTCQCSRPGARRLLPDCPTAAGGPPPPQASTSSGEVIQNLTGRNLSDFLVKTYPRLVRQGLKTKKWVNEVRYGGFSLGGRDPGLPSGLEVSRSVEELRALLSPQPGGAFDRILNSLTEWALGQDTQDSLKIWFNNKGWHAMVAFVNRANNALLHARLPPGHARHNHSITMLNHPLNLTKEQLSEVTFVTTWCQCASWCSSFWPSSRRRMWPLPTCRPSCCCYSCTGDGHFQSPLRWEVVGKNLLAMAIQGPIFLLFTLLLQHRNRLLPEPKLRLLPPLGEEDEDVARERERVMQGATQGDVLVLRDLTKVYPGQRTPAVDRLCLGIPPGECFGLLGVNGAGKTSTFRMVTGDKLPSGGEAVLAGHSVTRDPAAAHRCMGYCPQSDAIFELLTGREHLELFARLRGVPEAQVAETARSGLCRLGLPQYADQPAGTYSGGNKRKLATAVALVGDPAVVFLDEPTTGMDPSARRFLWNSLLAVVRQGRSVVLTSHSMEECEALCTRLAIMVNGRFRCLGSTQRLKSRFGTGHTLTLRVPLSRSELAAAFVEEAFPGAELREAHGGHLRFQLPPGGRCSLAHVFGKLAAHGAKQGVEDFSVNQTTLEEVFLYMSEDQGKENQEEAEVGTEPVPGPQRPKLITQFLDNHSMAETVL
ncbi:phospholipid-transporting ATPase ABCA7 isoform X8 [Phacochoerus africanus]|uniref:phospholipid-transporting ATPase ABCA7 isoform X8 n=1 Tax=Phacochoerus africanus TaxID=41426 RepID=UPI001FD94E4F|nr:phospholipid-transporting ATPase ABCA7 isoform X8 [Phacochoerus africanus]